MNIYRIRRAVRVQLEIESKIISPYFSSVEDMNTLPKKKRELPTL